MDEKTICAEKIGHHDYVMCEHCSSMKFNENGSPYWMCNKYNTKLNENKEHFLLKCKSCLRFHNNNGKM